MALQNVTHRLVTDGQAQVSQGSDNTVVAPGAIFSRHAHHQSLQFLADRGRPGAVRCWEPSNFFATSLRCQARMVSGFTMLATSAKICLPSFFPIAARALRSLSLSRILPLI